MRRTARKKVTAVERRCASIGCPQVGADLQCARCGTVAYCSKACQAKHWREGGHRVYCRPRPRPPADPAPRDVPPDWLQGGSDGAGGNPAPVDSCDRLDHDASPCDSDESGDSDRYHTASDGEEGDGRPEGEAEKLAEKRDVSRATGSQSKAAEPEHPCPICLDNADDDGLGSMCYSCGQQFCGDCVPAGLHEPGAFPDSLHCCPMCRADMTVSRELRGRKSRTREREDRKEFAGFKNLAEVRAPGRHTAPAQMNLAMMYMDGEGTPRDRGEGMRLLKLAVKSGHAQAQHNLAVMYYNGMQGLPSNAGMAARLYRLAADQGLAPSQCNLGGMVANGNSVPQDYVEALRLIRAAAAKQPKARTVLEQVEYGNLDIISVLFSHVSQLHFTPHAPRSMFYFVAILIWCGLVVGIRCCDQFGASGSTSARTPRTGPVPSSRSRGSSVLRASTASAGAWWHHPRVGWRADASRCSSRGRRRRRLS